MDQQRVRLTVEELTEVESHLRESLDLMRDIPETDSLVRDALELSLNLVRELHHERAGRRESSAPPPPEPSLEVEALREFVQVLLRIAQISERHWFQMAEDDRWFMDSQYRHQIMTKLGAALREFRRLMNEKGEVVKNKLVSIETSNSDAHQGALND
jgi:hypothetical protein